MAGSFPALQFKPSQKPFVAFGIVPIADSHDLEDRSFIAVVQDAEAVTQITVSFSLNWPALEQRKKSFATVSFRVSQLCNFGSLTAAVCGHPLVPLAVGQLFDLNSLGLPFGEHQKIDNAAKLVKP